MTFAPSYVNTRLLDALAIAKGGRKALFVHDPLWRAQDSAYQFAALLQHVEERGFTFDEPTLTFSFPGGGLVRFLCWPRMEAWKP